MVLPPKCRARRSDGARGRSDRCPRHVSACISKRHPIHPKELARVSSDKRPVTGGSGRAMNGVRPETSGRSAQSRPSDLRRGPASDPIRTGRGDAVSIPHHEPAASHTVRPEGSRRALFQRSCDGCRSAGWLAGADEPAVTGRSARIRRYHRPRRCRIPTRSPRARRRPSRMSCNSSSVGRRLVASGGDAYGAPTFDEADAESVAAPDAVGWEFCFMFMEMTVARSERQVRRYGDERPRAPRESRGDRRSDDGAAGTCFVSSRRPGGPGCRAEIGVANREEA